MGKKIENYLYSFQAIKITKINVLLTRVQTEMSGWLAE